MNKEECQQKIFDLQQELKNTKQTFADYIENFTFEYDQMSQELNTTNVELDNLKKQCRQKNT